MENVLKVTNYLVRYIECAFKTMRISSILTRITTLLGAVESSTNYLSIII